MDKLFVAKPYIGDEEKNAVMRVLESGMLAQGPKVAELEKNFAEKFGVKYAIAVNSGTAAIHTALFSLGIKPGDEVITTPFTFVATANPIIMLGAKPVFVDVDEKTFNINPDLIKTKINNKTKAIIPVHLYGLPADMNKINKIADDNNLKVLEDACQAHGAKYNNKFAGNLGDVGAFSFYATKNMMCGEGGIITTNSEEIYEASKRFRQHGMRQSGDYAYIHLGYNYRITDLLASIAVEQLKRLDDFTKKRQENANYLKENLKDVRGIILPYVPEGSEHVWHQFTIRVTSDYAMSREELVLKLKENNIYPGVYYPKPLHLHQHFQKLGYKKGDFPVAEQLSKEVLSLPIHPLLSKEDLDKIVKVIR